MNVGATMFDGCAGAGESLVRGHSTARFERILGANFARALREAWG